ncbi:MAG: stage II sporulation protein R [Oscillospiraceae bacterium]|jgi:stage II sporulation protein R|nr:stage II sporulation protein R [Oscillospiraceae bacterium]
MESIRFKPWELALCAGLIIALLAGAASAYAEPGLSDKLIRLHVVAASDSGEDQALKLMVRDETLSALQEPLSGVTDVSEAERIIAENIPMLEARLRGFLSEQGLEQPVSAELKREAFPTREYSTFALPAGPYTALRVTLGGGQGQNWWCVVFPPLCAASAMERLPDTSRAAGLTEEEVMLITQADETYAVRFKLAEWLGALRNRFLKKQ